MASSNDKSVQCSIAVVDAPAFVKAGFEAPCPNCGAMVKLTDEPSCPKCMILLTLAPGVRFVGLAAFITVAIMLGATAGASLFAVFSFHASFAREGAPVPISYVVLMTAQIFLFASVIHGMLLAIGLIERVRTALLVTITADFAVALGAAAFIIWRVSEEIYFGF